jgi:hypothetical protein
MARRNEFGQGQVAPAGKPRQWASKAILRGLGEGQIELLRRNVAEAVSAFRHFSRHRFTSHKIARCPKKRSISNDLGQSKYLATPQNVSRHFPQSHLELWVKL